MLGIVAALPDAEEIGSTVSQCAHLLVLLKALLALSAANSDIFWGVTKLFG